MTTYFKQLNSKPKFYGKRNDPESYGFLCPHCNSRWGEPQRGGYIDVMRCAKCPSLTQKFQIDSNKRMKLVYSARQDF